MVNSIVKWGCQDNFKPVYLFLAERFRTHKNMSHINAHLKNCCLCCLVLAYFCFVSWFSFVTYFCAREIFPSKKINRLEIVLITSFYNTTEVYLYQPIYREFICTLSFWFMIICENLFFLSESFSISSYLWSSVRIYSFKSLWK